ncbi:MAG: hypothetical protein PHW77_07100 [Eubacteriales bacterium]|nr:hypothetical protein [Eubacteriales bacterium]
MNFNDCINFLYGGEELERISSLHTAPGGGGLFSLRKATTPDKLIPAVAKAKEKYCDITNIQKALSTLAEHNDADIGMTFSVVLKNILLEKNDFCYETNSVTLEVIEYERYIIKKASKLVQRNLSPEADAYRFMLKTAFEKSRTINKGTMSVINAMRGYYRINEEDERIFMANIGLYPSGEKFKPHTKAQIDKTRQELQRLGLIFSIRKSDGVIYDIIPNEIAVGIKKYFGTEIKTSAYDTIIQYMLGEYKKQYFTDVLNSFGIETPAKPNTTQLTALVKKHLKPSELMGGNNQSDGLKRQALADWCVKAGMNRIGSKPALIDKLLEYYEHTADSEDKSDYRVRFYKDYAGIASLNAETIKNGEAEGIMFGAEGLFSETTNYIFEIMLSVQPDRLLSKANITGRIKSEDRIYLYSAAACEKPVELSEHMCDIRASVEAEGIKSVATFIMIAGDFSAESVKECVKFYAENDVQICLLKAEELKELADKWAARKGADEFPVKYLRQNGRFDRKGCEFIA